MANTTCFRPIGPTVALAVTASSHAAVTVQPTSNDVCNYASFLNTGSNPVSINIAPANAGAATFAADGGTAPGFVLPAAMQFPLVYVVPQNTFSVTAIGSAAGPANVYITPLGDQS